MSSSKVVKCSSCNIVISELLAYIQNKIDVMDEVSMTRICLSAFKPEQISEAKDLLFDSLSAVNTRQRKMLRKGDGKSARDLEDMLCLFKSVDPDFIPTFVAKDLYNLPPIDFDHLDASKLLKDIVVLKNELRLIRDTYVTTQELDTMKRDIENLKLGSVVDSFENVNIRRGAYQLQDSFDSCQSGEFEEKETMKNPEVKVNCKSDREGTQKNVAGLLPPPRTQRASARPPTPQPPPRPPPRVETKPNEDKKVAQEKKPSGSDWTLVKKRKHHSKHGTGNTGVAKEDDMKFRAADSKVPIFITRVHKDTDEKDIVAYIEKKTKEIVFLVKLAIKNERHKAYKLFVPRNKLCVFLNPNFWPAGIYFRRFEHDPARKPGAKSCG